MSSRVVIVGAGFGGLALARALQLAGVSAIVYEQTGLHEQVASNVGSRHWTTVRLVDILDEVRTQEAEANLHLSP